MSIHTFDSCIFISNKPLKFSRGFRLTSVVLQELTAGAIDSTEVRYWSDVRKEREQDGTLLVPNGEDWWLAGKVLNSLLRGLKSDNQGKTPKLSPTEKHRIIRDVLTSANSKTRKCHAYHRQSQRF